MTARGDEHPWIEEHPAAGSVSQTPTNTNAPLSRASI
jgi:hypothetical protein